MADIANEPSLHFSGSIAQSNQAIVPRPSSTEPLNSHSNLNIHGQVEAIINLPVHEPQEQSSGTNVTNNANIANIMQEQQQPQYTPPSSTINFGMPIQLNAPTTARQLSRATLPLDGLQLDHQFPRRSSRPEQLNLVSPPRSPPLSALANAPPATNPAEAHNCTCPPIPRFKPRMTAFPVNPTSITFCSSATTSTPTTRQIPRGEQCQSVTPFYASTIHFLSKRFCTTFISPTAAQKSY